VELWGTNNTKIGGNNITANNEDGIRLYSSNNNSISGNNITANNWIGVSLGHSDSNTIKRNNITNSGDKGITLGSSNNNLLVDNIASKTTYGIELSASNNNVLVGNTASNNRWSGISLGGNSNSNVIYHNNFIDNIGWQAYLPVYPKSYNNTWDVGYPTGGNYWSDYTGLDANGDGIGDTPYVIDADNQDRYPLMHPSSPLPVHNLNTGLGYATIQEAINAKETLNGHTIFVEAGTYYENVVVNKTVSLIGENRETTIIDGKGIGNVVSITVYNVTVSDFKIQNSGTEYNSGIYFFNASSTLGNVTVRNNNITNNYYGVNVFSSFNVLLVGNNIANNEKAGVNLEQSFRNTVISNNVTANMRFGIVLYCADHNTLSDNNIKNNEYGIYVHCSSNNKIYHNNFINNSNQTYVEGYMNIWDDGYPSGGNYWSDYVGVDLYSGPYQNESGKDGIGDFPRVIDSYNQDNYPLMKPWPLVGDVNEDGKVDVSDLIIMVNAIPSVSGMSNWNPNTDINNDGLCDVADLVKCIAHIPSSW
jgi:parallel beta-helix repeat protein